MAHGDRARAVSNRRREYWTSRPFPCANKGASRFGESVKSMTHRIERARAQEVLRRVVSGRAE